MYLQQNIFNTAFVPAGRSMNILPSQILFRWLQALRNTMSFKRAFLNFAIIGSISIIFCSSQKINSDNLIFAAQIDSWTTEGNINYLLVNTTLTNTSSDTVKYVSMSCSWQDVYSTDTRDLIIYVNVCDKNVPQIIDIPPHDKRDILLKLSCTKSINQLQGLKFKIGFNFIAAENYDEMFSEVYQLTEMKNVIWSNTLRVR